ncbi:MAG: nuclear transport factor 2 family protein [Desulfobacterales bacterium]|nr:nuclear transport factor 2 family protein [Desulfobacterales bacterium]MCP4159555.1 nuclear transport factor 2 family protein [Deltaproteobacteria bacterium]
MNKQGEIEAVYSKISKAFGEKNIDLVLSFFSDSKDMIKISHGVVLRGKNELAKYYEKLKNVEEINISIENIVINEIDENHIWSTADEYITINGDQKKAVVSNIFVKLDTGWVILHDHTTHLF